MPDQLIDINPHCATLFLGRPNSTDAIVVREIWEENVYRVDPGECWGTVVDLGANIGAFSIYAAWHGAERVIAVEPEPDNRLLLEANASGYPHIIVYPCAVTDYDGEAHLTPSQGGSRLSETGTVSVPTVTLSTLFAQAGIEECAILKLDIEGSEYAVLDAMPSDLLTRVHYLTMEFHATDAATFGALVAKLSRTHAVQTLGSYERGGYIFARRY